ncbi:MAG: hypothetical protein VX939_09220 [Pseudomonadota bacterium]|nr:hypothetical protein [Pseudomonadota bacterium]
MANNSAALLIGDYPQLPRELWASFVQSGLVEHVLVFSSVDDLTDAIESDVQSVELDVKLIFFLVEGPEDLSTPIDLKLHATLSRVPLIAFHSADADITNTDIQTLYERRVSSVIKLPLKFQDLGQLVLQLDRYWSVGKLPECQLSLPKESIFTPRNGSGQAGA